MDNMLYILAALFAIGNAVAVYAYLRGKKSLNEREQNSAFFWEALHTGLQDMSQSTRAWIRRAFDPDFSLRNLMLVVLLALFAALALVAEYSFLQQTFALVLQETDEAPAIIGLLRFSHLLAIFICACSGIVGIFAADATHTFWFKLFAWNTLFIICLIEAYFGYTRATEFTILGSLQNLLRGNSASALQPLGGFPVVNAVLGFINPLLAAVTVRYLITFATWLMASLSGVVLFLGLWLPTWVAGNRALRYRHESANREESDIRASQGAASSAEVRPRLGRVTTELARDSVNEIAKKAQETTRDFKEADRRRRERVNANPFA